MCIDLVGVQYIHKIHYFGRAIKDARYALVNVGGRMVHVPDLMRYASMLQQVRVDFEQSARYLQKLIQKYGQRKNNDSALLKGAYAPRDLARIRFIDYGSLASLDSLSTLLSSIFNKTPEPSLL